MKNEVERMEKMLGVLFFVLFGMSVYILKRLFLIVIFTIFFPFKIMKGGGK